MGDDRKGAAPLDLGRRLSWGDRLGLFLSVFGGTDRDIHGKLHVAVPPAPIKPEM
jgi:hypothetical protein